MERKKNLKTGATDVEPEAVSLTEIATMISRLTEGFAITSFNAIL